VSGIGKEFMEATKYHNMGKSPHRLAMPPPAMEMEWTARSGRSRSRRPTRSGWGR